MAHYYINPNYQCYSPSYYSYDDQPYYSDHHNNYNYNYNYSSSSYVDHQLDYGGYANPEQFQVRYDQYQYYNSQFHSNPYQVLPSKSLIVYHNYNSAGYDNHPEFPAKKGSNSVDPDLSTGFVVAYSETTPNTDLDFEENNPEPFQGGYNMTETYGKPLPPSEDICYPPAKFDLTPPPPSPFGKGDKNVDHPAVKPQENDEEEDEDEDEDEDHISDSEDNEDEEDEEDEDEDEEEDEEEEEQDNRGGILIAPPLPSKEDQNNDQGGANPHNGRLGSPVHKASPQAGEANVSFINEKTRKEEQPLKPEQEEDEDEDEDDEEDDEEEEEEEEEEKEEKRVSWDDGRVEEKEIRRQIPPGYGLEALDLCEGVFGGYFPCLRKRNQGNAADQGGNNSVSYGSEDAYGDCWKTTMDYLFGDPNPYARSMPDPVYGYQRYYPQQPISEQIQYGGDCTWSTNSGYYYGYNNNGEGY